MSPFKPWVVFVLLLVTSAWPRSAWALERERAFKQYVRDVWTGENGLPQNTVWSIVQSQSGYLWLATQEGLVRFDGARFTVFDKSNTDQIKDNNIGTICEAQDGSLWFGSSAGLCRFKDDVFSRYTSSDGLPDNTVDSVFCDSHGVIWIGSPAGLTCYDGQRFSTYTNRDGLPDGSVLSTYEDRKGRLWISTTAGLSALKDGTFTNYSAKDGLLTDLIRTSWEDENGCLWIATDGGLNSFKDGKFAAYTTRDGLSNKRVVTVSGDRAGNLWVGTDGGGLDRFRDGMFTAYRAKDGLSDDSVTSVYEDREGNLWIGTVEGGLNRLKDGSFLTYTQGDGLADDITRSILQDRQGAVWIATRNGLSRFEGGRFTTYSAADGLGNDSVLSLFQDSDGELWAGTREGLSRFTGAGFITYGVKDGLGDPTILSMYQDGSGTMWIGTGSGLSILKEGKFSPYDPGGGLAQDAVYAICGDSNGALWLGTEGGGLKRIQDGAITTYTKGDGLSNDIVMSIFRDGGGTLWIGTTGGLNRFSGGRFTQYTTRNGLYDDNIFQVLEDSAGNLWMSGNKGIFRVNKQELNDLADGKINSVSSVSYGVADGMKSRECQGGFQPAGYRTSDGSLWFPTIRGVAIINPATLRINHLIPPVVIEQVIADNQPLGPGQTELPPGKQRFEFHFSGLSLLAPEKVRFKYMLEGFDKDWIDAGSRREAFYTNIPAGRYRFRVIAANNDGVWNEAGASFRFRLKPHFYQSYWFYLLCFVVAALVAVGLHRVRVRQVEARLSAVLAERNRIAREIHDTLAQGFVGISVQLETAARTFFTSPQTAIKHLDQARLLVRSSLGEARRSVLDLRHQALDSGDLASALSEVAKSLSSQTPIELCLGTTRRRLSPEVENNLFRIGQEALTNSVKHAGAAHIRLELEFEPKSVRLKVMDDGRGFDVRRQLAVGGGRLGLLGMRERVGQIGGHLNIWSEPGSGTEITVEVPAGQ
jgi:ligand-binding sensor domain-containing protein/signal transduction histidine kinase